jgi:3-oxoacyl-(acyl-carrier-protein) synthase/3-hydroxymyristoyl/3-hydroxydecanoyl-(acyl carrier protein) dehydratase
MNFSPIAIVGRSCVLPGVHSPEALWKAVSEGRDLITSVPGGRWRAAPGDVLCHPDGDSANRSWSDRGGYVEGFERAWDPEGFAVAARDLEGLDPLFHWALHCAREALRDAGDDRKGAVDRSRVSAIFGNLGFPSAGMTRYAEAVWQGAEDLPDARNRFMAGGAADLMAQALGLGPNAMCLDTACASSLYAIKVACNQLQEGKVDLALAGAVNCADDLFIHVGFTALSAMSRTGTSRPFHARADGLVPAEGAAFVALKRLCDARRDGDQIYGVIRGVGLSNDGRGRGFLAPAEEGQRRAQEQALAVSGIQPREVSLLECHATGTSVGDATEIRSTAAVYSECSDLPIGSLKSNMGHLITAAGTAGLIKVLEAMRHGQRPPTLHTDEANPALEGSPLRILQQSESWECEGPRIAAVSAFGFGGNNAHLLVSEDHESIVADDSVQTASPEALAIVAIGTVVGEAANRQDLARALLAGESLVLPQSNQRLQARTGDFDLGLSGLRFPPKDLQDALPQQLLLLKAAREAVAQVQSLPRERTGVFVGMEPDVEVCRYGLRWRQAQRLRDAGLQPETHEKWLDDTCEEIIPTLRSAGVIGTMPNIPANRLNSQFDLGGGSFSVSAGEDSGMAGLSLAARALQAGELDAAVVGAVDLSCQEVHEEALHRITGSHEAPGDAAVVLVLKRLADAQRDGNPVIATLVPRGTAEPSTPSLNLDRVLGRSWAAGDLRDLCAAALCLHYGTSTEGPSWLGAIHGELHTGGTHDFTLGIAETRGLPQVETHGPSLRFAAHRTPIIDLPLPPRAQEMPESSMQTMPPAPSLRPITSDAPMPGPAILPPVAVPAPVQTPITAAPAPLAAGLAETTADPRLEALREQVMALGNSAQQQIGLQVEAYERFVSIQDRAMAVLMGAAAGLPETAAPVSMPRPVAQPLPVPPRPQPIPNPVVQSRPAPAPRPQVVPEPVPVAEPKAAAPPVPSTAPIAAPEPTGPTFDFEQLKVHSSGQISEIYGEMFTVQDDYHRQVRMPEPPLLLADRITGLDAEPGVMGKGTIWSESLVEADRWFMHQGHMPAGIMIESGQADLMLISYMGVDFTNRGERVYRLLGCELTYYGGLPATGELLKYDIHMDGHATQGDVRLMFFHSDCRADGELRLSVRKGQAGFFTDAELADSDGCLWSPEEQEIVESPRLDAPHRLTDKRDFSCEDVRAFADGRPWQCFGEGFDLCKPHTRTPRIQNGPMLLLGDITGLDAKGGPWGRGYAKSTLQITPETWFFDGHFKNDPCMPGTLMFEGCLQLMAFYMAGLGYTIQRDGWRFEPVPGEAFQLSCRGQVTPTSGVLTYELFVEEVHDGPVPMVYADLLCTVDGLKAFHARRVAIQLTPSWPLDEGNPLLEGYVEPKPVAHAGDFPFDYRSLLACANGRPSEAFGPIYERFDGPGRVARLPNPPYHFLSRVTRVEGEVGSMSDGMEVDVEFDIDPSAWYFEENGCRAMPFAVLLEAALQPCGWLASAMGCALTTDIELCFRNLDGTGTLHVDVLPDHGTLLTRVKSTKTSSVASMIIVGFEVECSIDGVLVYSLDTVFGFFPEEALANQVGLPTTDIDRALLEAPPTGVVDLRTRPSGYWEAGRAKLAEPMLLMLDRVDYFDPTGGEAGLGVARGEKDVDPGEWFFKAHFFQDPVQPGSLGIEAMIQLLQWTMLEKNMDAGIDNPRFETLGLGEAMEWKYRGQVVPTNRLISSTLEITEVRQEEGSVLALAKASLWVDGKRIYEASNLGMRIVSGGTPEPETRTLDPDTDTWLNDHCPTWTVPALPMMSMVDLLAQGACTADPVTALRDVRVTGWLDFDGPRTLRTRRSGEQVRLLRVDADGSETEVASAKISTGEYRSRPDAWAPLQGEPSDLPYEGGELFHGPAFQVLESLVRTSEGASSVLSAHSGLPLGRLNPALLDGATHGIPHDQLQLWDDRLSADKVAYPALITEMHFYGSTPTRGTVRCEVRPDGLLGSADFPAFSVQLIGPEGVWCTFRLVESCFPKGTIGSAAPADRMAFLRDHLFVSGLRLSRHEEGRTRLSEAEVESVDWLPGTVQGTYGSRDLGELARKEHIAHAHQLHPSLLPEGLPLHRFELSTKHKESEVEVTGDGLGELDLSTVRRFWSGWFDRGPWPVEDLYYGLIERFVGRVVLTDPEAFAAQKGQSLLYLGNHQVGIESLLFSILASALGEVPTVTLAKDEHRKTWLGKLISHCFTYPEVEDPRVIAFFDRQDKASLPRILGELAAEMMGPGRSVMVHIEGTRSLDCTTPVQKMSGAFLDMAIQVNAPVVPIRFVGALPRQPLDQRIEFPIGMGRQDIYIGRPILPEELAGLHYGDRKRLVIEAINALGPANAIEQPLPGDEVFDARVNTWQEARGVSQEHAVLREVFAEVAEPTEEVRQLLEAESTAALSKSGASEWLQEMGRRLLGGDTDME